MNTPIRHIVAATDFSNAAERALQRAARLAQAHGATLELVHAAPLPMPMPVWGDMAGGTWIDNDELVSAAEHRLARSREALVAQYPGLSIRSECQAAMPVPFLLERADAGDATLLVIGATGEGALARRLFGSTAQAIVRHATRPVLVVRLAATADYARLLVASDFSDTANRAARLARALAGQADVSLFTALEHPRFALFQRADEVADLERGRRLVQTRLEQLAGELGAPQARLLIRDGRASHELDQALAESAADLLAVGAHGKSLLETGLLGSTSQHAVAEAPCDVLVVRDAT